MVSKDVYNASVLVQSEIEQKLNSRPNMGQWERQ